MKGEFPLGVALQGGGAHGAYAWGILDRLIESGRFAFEGVSATSAGAMNAVIMAQGYLDGGNDGARRALAEFWGEVSRVGSLVNPIRRMPWERIENRSLGPPLSFHVFDTMTRLVSPYWYNPLDINPLRDIVAERVDFEALRSSGLKLFINATNVRTGRVRVFHSHELDIDVVMASACLPYLFQAVEIGGETYWDGGYSGNPSLHPFFYHTSVADLLLVMINPLERASVPTSGAEITDRINEVSFNASLLHELRAVAFVQKLIEQEWLTAEARQYYRHVRVHAIRADRQLRRYGVATKFESDKAFIDRLFGLGRRAGERWLEGDAEHVGQTNGVDLNAMFLLPQPGPGSDEVAE